MSNQTYTISTLLEKLNEPDKDFRYMAANDLINELQKETVQLDDETEKKVVSGVLKILDDKNGEVQNLAVKCLGPLIRRARDVSAETIVDKLCFNTMTREKDQAQLRDISSMALKTVFHELPSSNQGLVGNLSKRVTGKLHPFISKEKVQEVSIHLEILEIIGTLLQKHGHHLVNYHSVLMDAFFPLLKNNRMAVRKRAITALSNLVNVCSEEMFETLIQNLLREISLEISANDAKTTVQFLEGISRAAGLRFGKHLHEFIGYVLKFAQQDDDELREYCFHTMETFLQKCPTEVSPFVLDIVNVALKYLSYDPNYSYTDEDMEEDTGADGDEGQFSDDEDISWKVRRGAVKCLEAVITTRREYILDCLKRIGPALIARFYDREDAVRVDVINAFSSLLQQTDNTLGAMRSKNDFGDERDLPVGVSDALREQLPALIKASKKLIVDKSIKSRQATLQMLSRLVGVLKGCLTEHFHLLLPGLEFCLVDKSSVSNIKLEALYFLQSCMSTHPPELFAKYASQLIKIFCRCIGDSFYKVIAESLAALQQLISVLRPVGKPQLLDVAPFAPELYGAILSRFKDSALDQEIKERAVSCMGQLMFSLGDYLRPELKGCLPIFIDRLKNEPTRLSTMNALVNVTSSPLHNDVSEVLDELLNLSTSFLRKNLRNLRLATLQLIVQLFNKYGTRIDPQIVSNIVKELPPLIHESDLLISEVSLRVIAAAGDCHPLAIIANKEQIVKKIVEIGNSAIMQGGTLTAVIDALKVLVASGAKHDKELTPMTLIKSFLQPVYTNTLNSQNISDVVFSATHRQGFFGTAKCVAALAIASGTAENVVATCIDDIRNPASSENVKMIAFAVIGEIGYYCDLSRQKGLQEAFNCAFETGKDDSKMFAAMALGKICGGNIKQFVPAIIKDLENEVQKQYVLLNGLKELIHLIPSERISAADFAPYVDRMWNALLNKAGSVEEGYRNLLGECLGKLTALDPQRFVPVLGEVLQKATQVQVRCTMVTAIKYTISEERREIDQVLKDNIGTFLACLDDSDLTVRRTALTLFNCVAHNKPVFLKDKLNVLLPLVYKETIIKPELIREVEMGPFKHEVDDGLDCRKAAYECLYTLLDACLDHLNIFEFIEHVSRGLNDHYDIKTLCFLFVRRLVSAAPNAVTQRLEQFTAEISKVLQIKVKPSAVKQEFEKTDELKRAALRAVHALTLLPDADKSRSVVDLQNTIKSTPELAAMWEQVKSESSPTSMSAHSHGDVPMDTS
ncbi:cullin-associated NEDD8-dissociated protein 1-like [Paramacrobiotus metropolitanus]|uniref:cullin-associated NEDD8-dissociated protein 1-like n=1 Tax=Paramacrobiotus metropolitanus TaxID=2943436 RepID=UPI002445FD45|nr:cullin-associated NEDD8-dissociated protein 1-like [Paramacrobiotus metropolitanus]